MGYTAVAVEVKAGDLEVFESCLRSPTVPQELAVRAKILIASARGEGVRAYDAIAARLNEMGVATRTGKAWVGRRCVGSCTGREV